MMPYDHNLDTVTNRCKGRSRKREEVMRIAAVSATLAPTCRNSQKGVKKLLVAAAAYEKGLQHCDIAIRHHIYLGPQRTDTAPGPTPTHPV